MLSCLFNHNPERYEVSQFRTRRSWVRSRASYDEMREKTGNVIFKGKHALANVIREIRRQWYPTHANYQIVISSLAKSRDTLLW